jgi:hypothetical protein
MTVAKAVFVVEEHRRYYVRARSCEEAMEAYSKAEPDGAVRIEAEEPRPVQHLPGWVSDEDVLEGPE